MTPIEQMFWDAARSSPRGIYMHPRPHMTIDEVLVAFGREKAASCMVAAQVGWGKFVIDFVVVGMSAGGPVPIVVECDGHDFHERTKEQARRDRSRDRQFITQGIPVLRFTGSEIWAGAERCIDDVIECLEKHDAVLNRMTRPRPGFVQDHLRNIMSDRRLDWRTSHVALTASDVVDNDGVARVSFELLRQYYEIQEDHLHVIGFDLTPYLSMRSIDVHGRIVFRFHKDDARGQQ